VVCDRSFFIYSKISVKTMTTQEINRYPHDWPARSRDAKLSRKQGEKVQCSCCRRFWPWDEVEVHHSSYQLENDRAGVNIFPVCGSKQDPGTCHHWLHKKENWIKDRDIWKNRNTDAVVRRLQDGYTPTASASISDPISEDFPWLGIAATIAALAVGWVLFNPFRSVQPQQRTAIIESPVNVRQGPGSAYPKNGGPLAKGTTVEILEEKDGWIRVNGRSWIFKNQTKSNRRF
jgi:SH3-like domain-containing protein